MLETDEMASEVALNCTQLGIKQHFKMYNLTVSNTTNLNNKSLEYLFNLIQYIKEDYRHENYEYYNRLRNFIANCLNAASVRPFEISDELKLIWGLVFGLMLLTALIGNAVVLWIILAHRQMRTVTNYFLLNLSLADLLMSSFNCIFNFIFLINSNWPFGSIYCSINNFIANVTVGASVFTLVAIAYDRYSAIVRPLQQRIFQRRTKTIIIFIWTLSTLISLPCLIYSTITIKRYSNGITRTVCIILWPDGSYPTSKTDYIYNIFFLVFTYGIPMIIIVICYTKMGRQLWGSKSIGEHTERQHESIKSKRKVVHMFIIIVILFVICWMPYQIFFIYSYHNTSLTKWRHVQHLYLGFYWLAMSNAMINPIIYYWMNRRFRRYFKRAFRCCNCYQLINSYSSGRDEHIPNDPIILQINGVRTPRDSTKNRNLVDLPEDVMV